MEIKYGVEVLTEFQYKDLAAMRKLAEMFPKGLMQKSFFVQIESSGLQFRVGFIREIIDGYAIWEWRNGDTIADAILNLK